jgi:hypothetical protein
MPDEAQNPGVSRPTVVILSIAVSIIAVLVGFTFGWYLHPSSPPEPILVVSATGPFASFSLAPFYIQNVTGLPTSLGFGFSVDSPYHLEGQWTATNSNASMFLVSKAEFGPFWTTIWDHHPADYVYADVNVTTSSLNATLQPGGYYVVFLDLTTHQLAITITESILAIPAG